MKLAIIGSSPIACEAVVRFHHHGAALTWFNGPEIEPEGMFQSVDIDWKSRSSEQGRGILARAGIALQSARWGWKEWKDYASAISVLLKEDQEIKPHAVVSITKRYLGHGEEIPGKSRFHDLFRVIYQVDPQDFIAEQKKNDPETYKRLSQEMVESLQTTIEMYEDFDVVLDLRRATRSKSIAHSGRALGEYRIGKDVVHYGYESLAMSLDPKFVREVAVVGSGEFAAEVLLHFESWLKDEGTMLFLITHEENPFEAFLEVAPSESAAKLRALFNFIEEEFEKDISEFTKKLRQWQELDDFVQVKIPRPAEPIPRLNYFSGHNVTAIDQLVDRRRLFMTLEKADFREGRKHPENNKLELKTIGVDQIVVATGFERDLVAKGLSENEKGFFSLVPSVTDWSLDENKLKGIEDEIFKLFTPTDIP